MPVFTAAFSRALILTWLISWILTVPLFHVHLPNPKDGPVSLHSGLAHTVFSSDLPGEFSHFSIARTPRSDSFDLSQRPLNYPELGFAVLNNNLPKDPKMGEPTAVGASPILPDILISYVRSEARLGDIPPVVHGPPTPSRAPPFLASM